MIAGEGLVGILLAVLAVVTIKGKTVASLVDLSVSLIWDKQVASQSWQ